MTIEKAIDGVEVLAKFFAKVREEDDPHFEQLNTLDDKWAEVYASFRSKSFGLAQLEANKYIIGLFIP